jgi:hypothetical protein
LAEVLIDKVQRDGAVSREQFRVGIA